MNWIQVISISYFELVFQLGHSVVQGLGLGLNAGPADAGLAGKG